MNDRMTYRERFEATLAHRPVDRPPMDLDSTDMTGIEGGPRSLAPLLGLGSGGEAAALDEAVLVALDTDIRGVGGILRPQSALARRISDREYTDCWGLRYQWNGHHYEMVEPPLAGATLADIERYPWPEPDRLAPGTIDAIGERARFLRERTPYVVCGRHPCYGVLELGCWIFGFDDFLYRLAGEPEFVQRFFEIIWNYQKRMNEIYYGAIGRYLHFTTSGDDFGTQTGPFMSPAMFADRVAPFLKQRIAHVRQFTPARFFHHTCGSVHALIPTLIACGVEILNPIQPGVPGMEPWRLKADFGDRLTFYGGVDTQRLLPRGTPEEVEAAVRDLIAVLGRDGGYVLSAAHHIQEDVPPANAVALYRAARPNDKMTRWHDDKMSADSAQPVIPPSCHLVTCPTGSRPPFTPPKMNRQNPAQDHRGRFSAAMLLLLLLLFGAVPAAHGAEVCFQNGVAPTPEYRGCVDTQISIHKGEGTGVAGAGKAPVLQTYVDKRRILVRFELSAIPAGKVVTKAWLRLYCATPARLETEMLAAPLTQAWDETATGLEHRKTDDDKSPEGNWKTAGGDYDAAATVKSGIRAGAFGHAVEFGVTALAAGWVAGTRPNHGVVCWSGTNGEHEIASSEWPVAAYRPELLVEYAASDKGDAPSRFAALPAPPKNIALSPIAATPDPGKGGEAAGVVRLGLNSQCALRDGTADAYVKTHPEMAGRWGWMTFLRVGGSAGDFNAALLRFDLAKLPSGSSIRSARLRLCVAGLAGSPGTRFGLYRARAGAPAWDADTVTPAQWRDGAAWGRDGLRGAFEEQPVAVASKPRPGTDPATGIWLEWDVTGAVRASAGAGAALSVAVLHDLEGGAFDAYSSKYHDPARRPVLEIELSPAPAFPASAPLPAPASAPTVRDGEDWIAPMKAVHARFKGKPGTLGQYGDSITYAMAFLAAHSYGASCVPEKCPEDLRRQLAVLDTYARKSSWRDKGVPFGNISAVTSDWGRRHIREWQERLRPEVAVIMFGTNDASKGPVQPGYMENLAYMVDRCLADGTIPILTTASPRTDQKTQPYIDARVRENREAVIAIARAKRIPLIDYYGEILARQPENWDKTLMGDSKHPSAREPWRMDFTEEGLKNSGYTLRNYLTLRMYADIVHKVLLPAREPDEARP